MYTYEHDIHIERPLQEVFDFMSDHSNDTKWQTGIESVEKLTDGPVGVGTTLRYGVKLLGRRIDSDIEIVAFDRPNKVSVRATSGPIPFETSYLFKAMDGGTHITIKGQANIGGFFKLAEGLVGKQLNKQLDTDLNSLKLMLEAETMKAS